AVLASIRTLPATALGYEVTYCLGDYEAEIDAKTGHLDRALARYRQNLAAMVAEVSPEHADVIAAKIELGKALVDHGDIAEARDLLDGALASADRVELATLMRADLEFAAARASDAAGPAGHARAVELARRARGAYVASAPRTRYYDDARAD